MKKRIAIAAAVLVVLVAAGAYLYLDRLCRSDRGYPLAPSRIVQVSLPAGNQDTFLGVLEDFAGANGFSFRLSRYHPELPRFGAEICRDDLGAFASNPLDLNAFRVRFYERRVEPLSPGVLDELVAALGEAVAVIDGTRLTELPVEE